MGRVLTALIAGLLLGVGIARTQSATGLAIADAIQPIGVLWINAIRMTVIPLITALLITGVASVSDLRSVGRLGGRTLAVFASLLVGSAVASAIIGPLLFSLYPFDTTVRPPLPAGATEAARDVAASTTPVGVVEWVTSLVPSNPVAAAADGNMVPLIVFVFLLALAAAHSPPATREPFVAFFRSLGDVMLRLVGWIIALAPIAIFALVLPLAARSGATLVGAVGFYVVAFAVACLLVTLLLYPVVAFLGRRRMRDFARSVLPSQLIGMSASSSIATLPAMVASSDALGVRQTTSGFVLPLAVSIFKPAAAVAWTIGVLFMGKFYGVPIGVGELTTVALASIFLSFAAPGVPRGAFLLLTPLFVQLRIPVEGIGVLIAIDLIPDMFATVVNVTGDVAAAAIVDGRNAARPAQPSAER
jgi:Na+/H+-dicarboxylate symporter